MKEECYVCGSTATSREHVPPRCLFPEQKDIVGIDLKKNLITVPSCDEHNGKKSNDDEFLMVTLSGIVSNNIIGYIHTKTKVKRSLDRKKRDFTNYIIFDTEEAIFKTSNGTVFPVLKGAPDIDRLKKCFEHIAFGLYLEEFNKRFEGELVVFIGFVKYQDDNLERIKSIAKKELDAKADILTMKGANPLVFKYQFCPPDPHGTILMRMVFYEGAEIFVSYREKFLPFNLFLALSKISDKTIFKLDSGETIELEKDVKREDL